MLRRTHLPLLALVIAASALGGCASSGFNLVSLEDEWQLGRELEADVNRQVTLVNDATLQRYVDQMGQRIVARTEMARLPWRFHVVQDPQINAFNIPGGTVYVNTGLIAAAGSAAELAGVLAHEIAHGVARHGTERLTQQQGANVLAALLLGQDPGLVAQIAAQVAAGGAFAKFSRDDEREADRLGVRYMAAAGYDPEGMARMFERLLADQRQQPGAVAQFFSTHPLTEERLADVRREAQRHGRRGLAMNDNQFAGVRQRAERYR